MDIKFTSILLLIVLVNHLEASSLDYISELEEYLQKRAGDRVSDVDKAVGWLNHMGTKVYHIDEGFLNNYLKIIRFLNLYDKRQFCSTESFESVIRPVRLGLEQIDEHKAPSLKAMVEPQLRSFAELCRDGFEDKLSNYANKIREPVKTFLDQIFDATEPLLQSYPAYQTSSPLEAASLLSDHDMATAAYLMIVGQNDNEVQEIVQPGKGSLPLSLVSSVLLRFVKAPCSRFISTLSLQPEDELALTEISKVLGRDNRERAALYNTVSAKYSICTRFTQKPSTDEDNELLERQLGRVITEKNGKKIKGSGLLSCLGIGNSC